MRWYFDRFRRCRGVLAAAVVLSGLLAGGVLHGEPAGFFYADEFDVVPDDGISEDSDALVEPDLEPVSDSGEADVFEIDGLIEVVEEHSDSSGASGKKDKKAKMLIVGFGQKGCLSSIHFEMGQKPSADQLMAQCPSQLEVYFQEEKKPKTISVSWQSYSDDYSSTDLNYYFFTPVFDSDKYEMQELNLQTEMPYIEVIRDAVSYEMIESAPPKVNEAAVLRYCREVLRLNTAACCGILANIYCESGFRTNAIGDNGTSVGICQWHNSRWTNLKAYVPNEWETLTGQLRFMRRELNTGYKDTLKYLRSVSDDAQGAYDAAYYWCMHYEMPDKTLSRSITRGYLAKNVYWERYKNEGPEDEEAVMYRCVSDNGLKIRSEGSLNADVIGLLKVDDMIAVSGTQGKWAIVSIDGTEGYCLLEFLEKVQEEETENSED